MEITNVRVRLIKKDSNMKGIASVTLENAFVVQDIRIVEGQNGLFIAMPSRRLNTGEFRDIAHPINSETRKMFEDAIFEEYNKMLQTEEQPALPVE